MRLEDVPREDDLFDAYNDMLWRGRSTSKLAPFSLPEDGSNKAKMKEIVYRTLYLTQTEDRNSHIGGESVRT